jgi:probable O-glycosylation ligase (exosortase A-associated)
VSIAAAAWVTAFGLGVLASFREPYYGLLAYLLDYYQHPPLRWWGVDLPAVSWTQIAAGALLLAFLVRRRNLFGREILGHPQTRWLLAFLAVAAMVTPFAVSLGRSVHYLGDLAKLTLLYGLIIGTVRTRRQFQGFLMVMILGAAVWGIASYFDPIRQDGRLIRVGGPDSFNDNSAAAHLLPTLPLLALGVWSGGWWRRIICIAAAPLIVNTIMLCNSRGATIAIAVSFLAATVLARGWLRLAAIGMVIAGIVLGAALADRRFLERQMTTLDYEEDGSAMGRIESWKGALRLIGDHPFGVGGGGFDVLSPIYIPAVVEAHGGEERAAHNTYLWVGTDWGILGLLCFTLFIGSTLLELHRIRGGTRDRRVYLESLALEIGLIGFLVAAFFINRPYAQILYWLPALTASLRNQQLAEQAVPAPEVLPAPARLPLPSPSA